MAGLTGLTGLTGLVRLTGLATGLLVERGHRGYRGYQRGRFHVRGRALDRLLPGVLRRLRGHGRGGRRLLLERHLLRRRLRGRRHRGAGRSLRRRRHRRGRRVLGEGFLAVRLLLGVRRRLLTVRRRLLLPVLRRLLALRLTGHLLTAVRLPLPRLALPRLALDRLSRYRLALNRLPLNRLPTRHLLLPRPPGLPPRLARGRCGLPARNPRIAVSGQHNALSRGLARRIVRVVALSALRHRDSYDLLTYGSVGSRYRVAVAFDHVPWSPPTRNAPQGPSRPF
ncbi:hypothetical protein GKJPGBOP_03310 [Streptomyces paromomycinus]|uniref:Uncharacterized protein n=1 Tax=Streptomyces paromomycinus TaxID=92743 RepID=A0A401W2S7_STREY|nr:hypothetical protein GKJPGBOP_03310 [Streptomyces paromomycinus]